MPKILPLDAATYTRHALHRGDRAWTETNCYTDVIIELLHGMGFEPLAAMAFTLSIDFDVDQWTFFKFHPADLEELYAVGLHELAPWRPLVVHVEENVAAGRPVVVELDSFFLPDTAGAAYKLAHVKSTVAVNEIDVEQRRLGYFHNQSYHHLSGQDFGDIFQTEGLVHARMLPPYIEFVKAPYLSDHEMVLRTFEARIQEILEGTGNMNCQMCKYREQVLGFEAETGLPQESHHHHVEGIGSGGHSHDHGHGHDHGHDHGHGHGLDHGHAHGHGHDHHHHPYPHADHPLGPKTLKTGYRLDGSDG